jgi:hypothetical protein
MYQIEPNGVDLTNYVCTLLFNDSKMLKMFLNFLCRLKSTTFQQTTNSWKNAAVITRALLKLNIFSVKIIKLNIQCDFIEVKVKKIFYGVSS